MRGTVAGTALVAMLVCSGAMAEDAAKYGGKFALNFANQAGDDNEPFDELMFAFGLGGTVEVPLGPDLVLETGLLWMRKGGQGSLIGVDLTMVLDYIEVPVLAKYSLAEGKASVSGGLTLAFLLKAEATVDFMGVSDSDDVTDEIRDLDICIAVGGGGSFPAGEGTLNVGVQYSRGLITIDKDGDFDSFNQTISVTVGYTF